MAATLTSDDARYGDLFDITKEVEHNLEVQGDLTPGMNALRDKAPVQHGCLQDLLGLHGGHSPFSTERDHYTLLNFECCERALRENTLFSSTVYKESPGVQRMGKTILEMVGDEHRRHRAVVQPMFLRPKAEKWWKPKWIDAAVDALLDRFSDWDRVDLNTDLCARLPVHVVTMGMGMSGDDALTFRHHLMRSTVGAFALKPEEVQEAAGEVRRMLDELIEARRVEPGDDVVSGLVGRELQLEDGTTRPLTNDEIFGYCRLIMVAGGGTTWRQLGITLTALLSNYHFWELCREDRGLIERAVEEAARWLPTDPIFARLMTDDVDLGGVIVPKGARVDLCFGAANRDPARWENPDMFDPTRKLKHHLGFALGPHMCLGKNIAVQEMIVAINGLMDRFPNIRLDPDVSPARVLGGLHQRGMDHVKVLLK